LRSGIVFTLDAQAAALLEANAGARAMWGLSARLSSLPLPIDRAMPAVQRLREIARGPVAVGEEALIFWTARGMARLFCTLKRVEPLSAPATFRMRAPAQEMPGVPGPGDGSRRQVALGAWLAHELRTPLSAIIACAEILKSEHFGPLANVRYRGYAQAIFDSAHHALGVVDGILRGDPARPGVPPLAFADLDPTGVVESCLAVARPLADQAGLVLGDKYDPHLPRIIADELSLRQMLLNLIGNAIKFARRGDRITVAVAYGDDGPLTISVADTGPGLPRPWAQEGATPSPAAKTAGVGLGLGLPLTKALADANGAALAIDSAPGVGTRVTISFGKDRIVPI
jgi:signal transduction histidine kinase